MMEFGFIRFHWIPVSVPSAKRTTAPPNTTICTQNRDSAITSQEEKRYLSSSSKQTATLPHLPEANKIHLVSK
jgi:hypothetical protein